MSAYVYVERIKIKRGCELGELEENTALTLPLMVLCFSRSRALALSRSDACQTRLDDFASLVHVLVKLSPKRSS